MTWDSQQSQGRNDPASDLIPFSGAILFGGGCRAIRCLTAGSFVGVTIAGNSRTVSMFNPGDLLPVGFLSITSVSSGTYEALV